VNIVFRKVQIFTLSAVLAGIAGSFDAALQSTIAPTLFSPDVSLQLFLMVVLGGLGSIPGAVIGTALVLGILQVVPGTGDYALTVMGVAVVVAMAVIPGGIAGLVRWLPVAGRRLRSQLTSAGGAQLAGEAAAAGDPAATGTSPHASRATP
jgi:branched-chain amino acid transport system permease protein